MASPRVQITQVEMLQFLEQMQNFHQLCIKTQMRVKPEGYIFNHLKGLIWGMDETAELITGKRRFLYEAKEGTKIPNLHERGTL